MAIDNPNIVDATGISDQNKMVILYIEDKFQWIDSDIPEAEHLKMLEDKINAYLRYWRAGEVLNLYPQAGDYGMALEIRFMYKVPEHVKKALNQIGTKFKKLGIPFRYFVNQII